MWPIRTVPLIPKSSLLENVVEKKLMGDPGKQLSAGKQVRKRSIIIRAVWH